MSIFYLVVPILSVNLTVLGAGVVFGQDYPNRPIRIVTGGVGGANDFTARLIAQGISGRLGQQVIVDSRASGVVPGEIVSKATPDGYTLLVASGALWLGPLMQNTRYDAVNDFSPISLTNTAPNILVVHPSLPVRSVGELIALARARPGDLNYASGPTGASNHLAPELFKAMARVNITRIPYKSGATALADLIAGQVQLTFGTASAVGPHVKAGRLRALAVTSARPSALFPGFPTVAASGVPGYESLTINGIFAPGKTATMIINRLNQEIVKFLGEADAKEKLMNSGVEPVGSSPEQFAAVIRSEIVKWRKVITGAKIRVDL